MLMICEQKIQSFSYNSVKTIDIKDFFMISFIAAGDLVKGIDEGVKR